jgi:hypothetical protein
MSNPVWVSRSAQPETYSEKLSKIDIVGEDHG